MSKQPTVINSYVEALLHTVKHQGVPLTELLDGLGVTEQDLVQVGHRLDMNIMTQLWERAVHLTHDPDLGIHVADNIKLGSLNVVGHVVMHCSTLGDAMEAMLKFQQLVSQGGVLSINNLSLTQTSAHQKAVPLNVLKHEEALVGVEYSPMGYSPMKYSSMENSLMEFLPMDSPIAMTRYQVEGVLAALVKFTRLLFSEALSPVKVMFQHTINHSDEVYRAFFKCPVEFGADKNQLLLNQSDLSKENPFADAELKNHSWFLAEEKLKQLTLVPAFSQRVRSVIDAYEQLAECNPDSVAATLNMSLRTLQRNLKQEHASYQGLLDDVRKSRAAHLLKHTQLPVYAVAEQLGYINDSSFHRAFKRWYGCSPRVFRLV